MLSWPTILVLVNALNQIVMEVRGVSVAPGMGVSMTYPDVGKGRMRLRPTVVSIGDSCTAFHGTSRCSTRPRW